jgi:hypothetical protein
VSSHWQGHELKIASGALVVFLVGLGLTVFAFTRQTPAHEDENRKYISVGDTGGFSFDSDDVISVAVNSIDFGTRTAALSVKDTGPMKVRRFEEKSWKAGPGEDFDHFFDGRYLITVESVERDRARIVVRQQPVGD